MSQFILVSGLICTFVDIPWSSLSMVKSVWQSYSMVCVVSVQTMVISVQATVSMVCNLAVHQTDNFLQCVKLMTL